MGCSSQTICTFAPPEKTHIRSIADHQAQCHRNATHYANQYSIRRPVQDTASPKSPLAHFPALRVGLFARIQTFYRRQHRHQNLRADGLLANHLTLTDGLQTGDSDRHFSPKASTGILKPMPSNHRPISATTASTKTARVSCNCKTRSIFN